jgi:hypothetical protein
MDKLKYVLPYRFFLTTFIPFRLLSVKSRLLESLIHSRYASRRDGDIVREVAVTKPVPRESCKPITKNKRKDTVKALSTLSWLLATPTHVIASAEFRHEMQQ